MVSGCWQLSSLHRNQQKTHKATSNHTTAHHTAHQTESWKAAWIRCVRVLFHGRQAGRRKYMENVQQSSSARHSPNCLVLSGDGRVGCGAPWGFLFGKDLAGQQTQTTATAATQSSTNHPRGSSGLCSTPIHRYFRSLFGEHLSASVHNVFIPLLLP